MNKPLGFSYLAALRIAFFCFQSVRRQITGRGQIRLPSLHKCYFIFYYLVYVIFEYVACQRDGRALCGLQRKAWVDFLLPSSPQFLCFPIFHQTIKESHRFVCYSYGCYSVIPTAGFQFSRSESQFVHAPRLTSVQPPNFDRQIS